LLPCIIPLLTPFAVLVTGTVLLAAARRRYLWNVVLLVRHYITPSYLELLTGKSLLSSMLDCIRNYADVSIASRAKLAKTFKVSSLSGTPSDTAAPRSAYLIAQTANLLSTNRPTKSIGALVGKRWRLWNAAV
jgi:hypothetical protein